MPRRRLLITLFLLLAFGIAAVGFIKPLRWRVHVLALHLTGQIPDIELGELVRFMLPGSDQWIPHILDTHNPYAIIKNSHTSPADIAAGEAQFRRDCAQCHGPSGTGGPAAPALTGRTFAHGAGDWAIYRTIRLGVKNTAMAAHPLPQTELWQLVAYIRSLGGVDSVEAARVLAIQNARLTLPVEEIPVTAPAGQDWLTYSGAYNSHRHSGLRQITPDNVHQLALRWLFEYKDEPRKIETSPIVRHGVMFLTVMTSRVIALDAATGKSIWQQDYQVSPKAPMGEFGTPLHRGVAMLGDRIFVGTADGHLLAREAATGKVIWDILTSDDETVYFISAAPLVVHDMVIIGVGVRGGGIGYIAAFEAATGKERWRFRTIPGPGEPGHESWGGESWRKGGAPPWMTGSYDADQDLLIWGTGNPKPDYDPALRPGDNLYSNSVVALNATTGKLQWYFQFTPADERDWDANQVPVLYDRPTASGTEKLLLWANRNGFYYVIDRVTGKYLTSVPFITQNWTDGIDSTGRPTARRDLVKKAEGYKVFPGNVGGTNWWSPTLDPELGLIYLPVLEQGMIFFPSTNSWPSGTNEPFYTAVRALDARSGKLVWEYRRPPRREHGEMGSLLSTSTGVVFGGDQSTFFALDARTGRVLMTMEVGGDLSAPPVTYEVNGEQMVVISTNRNMMAFALPKAR